MSIGTVSQSFIEKTQAIKWALEQEERIERGVFGCIKPSEIALSDLLQRYGKEITPAKRGAPIERYRLRRLINDPISSFSIDQLTSQVLASFRDKRLKDGRRACQLDLIIIRHCLRIAINEWGLRLSVNPVDQIKKPPSLRPRERRLNDGEYKRLEEVTMLTQNPHVWPVVIFAIETGMRRSEILSLTWENISLQRQLAFLPLTKNGTSREVPLSTKAVDVLIGQGLQQDTPTPFPVNADAFRLAWERLGKRADLCDLRFHDLQHEAISRFFGLGLSIPKAALISGHKDAKMLFRYTHLKAGNITAKLG